MPCKTQRLRAARVLSEHGWLENAVLEIAADGKIAALLTGGDFDLDLGDNWLMPALIDSHVHGAAGFDTMDASSHALDEISMHFARFGVGAFLATTVTAPVPAITAALTEISRSRERGLPGAELLGSYLEGPYFTAKCCGAHPVQWMRSLDIGELQSWLDIAGDSLHTVALAPELAGSDEAIAWLRRKGVRVLIGHSDASYDQTLHALQAGAQGIVHCYNGMRGLHHRDPGVVGAGLTTDGCDVEMIADGHHVHPAAVKIALSCCGEERLLLITDAMRATGMSDGTYQLGEMQVNMQNGVVRTDVGGLAGSTLHLIDAVRHAQKWLGLPLERAWALASRNPARSLGLADLGSIAIGKKASLTLISPDLAVMGTWVQGRQVV
ncbi:N-acetylglucosamine-6-phosphate deacetylase [Iodobacter fluviatilis]|uniref:N-acetylglucosamine-6-phosphate deacetylase n=1 Tax=Iodobacter fluviatilis TaxID=537 RepID=A0A7G3G4B5_9NEIS|nr:N-acetylglucosamine-6-phosphate deacetylase [Iodobacter fluviatilis]QBC42240.1 N-acetylglucosamine-6-phosphate deacetylase [Iodobacter fluviatilis]